MLRQVVPSNTRRRASALARLGAVLAITVLAWAVSTPPASAHAALDSITPVDGSVLQEPPAQIELVFNEELLAASVKVAVTDGSGDTVIRDRSEVSSATVSVSWNPDLPADTYTIAYRVVSGDGHPITGQSTFTLDIPLATAMPSMTFGDAMPLTPAPSAPSPITTSSVASGPPTAGAPVAATSDEPVSLTDWRLIGAIALGTAGGIGIVIWQRHRQAQ